MTIETLTKSFDEFSGAVNANLDEVKTRIGHIEKLQAREREPGEALSAATWGKQFVTSKSYENFVAGGLKGIAKLTTKAAVTTTGTGAALVVPDRDPNGVMLPRRRMTVRTLLGEGRTGSSSVEYFRESLFTNAAAMVSEGALKPESTIEYELDTAPVRTIAHWIPASRQAMEDAPQLASLVDGTLRYGLAYREEQQFLYGDGEGENLHGLVPQATDYETARTAAGDTAFDVLRHALSQAEEAELPATGIILNTKDFYDLMGVKDSNGRYIGAGPLGSTIATIWQLPVVWTTAMAPGEFVVGALESATMVYDRMDPEVMASDQDRDNFIRNMWTIRAEQRLAFAVKRPAAIIHGSLPAISG